jgi:branched-chain amino acid transport system ATP-binding protein
MLEVNNISVCYGKVVALHGVSLVAREGGMVALIGANGAGKTTVLRTISGLEVPSSGEVWFQNERVDGLPPQKIVSKGVGHVPQGKHLFLDMTVLENLKMGGYLRKDKKMNDDLEQIYQHFPILKKRQSQRASRLSGGEQQMLAFGRALMSKPKLILFDEPSTGLAPIMVSEITGVIADINREEGATVILVEQNAKMALKLCQKGYVLETGSVVLAGNTGDLMKDPDVKRAYLGE